MARIERVGRATIELDLRFTAAGSVKPTDLLAAIFDLDPDAARSAPLYKTHAFYRTDPALAANPAAATALTDLHPPDPVGSNA